MKGIGNHTLCAKALLRIRRIVLQTAGSFLFMLCETITAQPLDWSNDVTIFGSPDDEHHPAISISPHSGILHALCTRGDTVITLKLSENAGASWGEAFDLASPFEQPRVCVAEDADFAYAVIADIGSSSRRLYRFTPHSTDWQQAFMMEIAADHTLPIMYFSISTDFVYAPTDPYLNVCWTERDLQSHRARGWISQSRNQGAAFLTPGMIFDAESNDTTDTRISLGAAWYEEDERLLAAADVERPGSTPPEIRVYLSDNQGETWDEGHPLDSQAIPQSEPSISAFQSTILLTYSRITNSLTKSDIFLCYSFDLGATFSPPQAIAATELSEHSSRVVVDGRRGFFYIFYLVDEEDGSGATLNMRSGSLASPWDIGTPIPICVTGSAAKAGNYDVTVDSLGIAAAWTAQFPLGDTDIRFDASWRPSGVEDPIMLSPSSATMGQFYPNPTNSVAILPFQFRGAGEARIILSDISGRTAKTIHASFANWGSQRVIVDLSDLSSGVYFARTDFTVGEVRRIILIR